MAGTQESGASSRSSGNRVEAQDASVSACLLEELVPRRYAEAVSMPIMWNGRDTFVDIYVLKEEAR